MGYSPAMRLSSKRAEGLQKLIKEQTGKDYTDEETQQDGLADNKMTRKGH